MVSVYASLYVSDKRTHVHILDEDGAEVWRGAVDTDPEALSSCLAKRAGGLARVLAREKFRAQYMIYAHHAAMVYGKPVRRRWHFCHDAGCDHECQRFGRYGDRSRLA